ncbi:MAG: hypothetical protein IPJ46_22760 [Anaerolineales bacterium]|nr:hypothetical protein [Anaerolineales bacterium]
MACATCSGRNVKVPGCVNAKYRGIDRGWVWQRKHVWRTDRYAVVRAWLWNWIWYSTSNPWPLFTGTARNFAVHSVEQIQIHFIGGRTADIYADPAQAGLNYGRVMPNNRSRLASASWRSVIVSEVSRCDSAILTLLIPFPRHCVVPPGPVDARAQFFISFACAVGFVLLTSAVAQVNHTGDLLTAINGIGMAMNIMMVVDGALV